MLIVQSSGARLVVVPPDSHEGLTALAVRALREAGVYGTIPTPIEALYEVGRLSLISDQTFADRSRAFLRTMSPEVHRRALLLANKVRGATNLRTKRVWVPGQKNERFERHPKLHEWGHNVIPWQETPAFLDDLDTLSPETREVFEREANFIAAEANFQAGLFRDRALGLVTSVHSALTLAKDHEATFASTLWKYVEVMDTTVALFVYGPSPVQRSSGDPLHVLRQVNMSAPFGARYESVEVPPVLDDRSPMREALEGGRVVEGTCRLRVGGETPSFLWEAWSNTYALFVMVRPLRRTSRLSGLLRPSVPANAPPLF